jgi:predicted DNA-binding transcriptional regulator YafY
MAGPSKSRKRTKGVGAIGRLRRLVRLLALLEAHDSVGSEALTHELGVSKRTIYRDVQLLNAEKFSIVYDHGTQGYRLKRRSTQPLPPVTAEELAALLQAGQSGGRVLPPDVAERCRQVASRHFDAVPYGDRVAAYLSSQQTSADSIPPPHASPATRSDKRRST